MKVYLDASFVVALLFPEVHSARARAFVAATDNSDFIGSPWLAVEVFSAIAIRQRMGTIARTAADDARHHFSLQFGALSRTAEITFASYERAQSLLERDDVVLRAGDALHLAVAEHVGASVASFDARMMKAAVRLGLGVCEL